MNVKIYYIQSESDPNKKYVVRDLLAEGWRCNCADFIFRERTKSECKHIIQAKEQIEKIKHEIKENIV